MYVGFNAFYVYKEGISFLISVTVQLANVNLALSNFVTYA